MLGFKSWLSVLLTLSLLIFTVIPTHAEAISPQCNCTSSTVYENHGKNVVVTIKEKDKTHYAVLFEPIVYNDLSDPAKFSNKVKSPDEVVAGHRAYFRFTKDLKEARKIAGQVNIQTQLEAFSTASTNTVAPEGTHYFWNNSYIETYWSFANGAGYHLYLSNTDASYVTSVAATISSALASTIAGFYQITKPASAAIGAAAAIAVHTLSWTARNSDGSLDLYSPDQDRWDATCVRPDQYVGSFKLRSFWYNLTYQRGWESFCM